MGYNNSLVLLFFRNYSFFTVPEKMFMLREWLKILWQLQCLICQENV